MRMLTMADRKKIAQEAEKLLSYYEINTLKEIDVVELASKMGFVVANAGLNDDDDGFIMVNESEKEILGIKTSRLIGVNANRSFERKKFIIAHEIGHFIMHCKSGKIYAHREDKHGKNERENDVDFFAACLLMPEDAFKREFNNCSKENETVTEKIKRMQEFFKVPLESVVRRVRELELG